MEPALEISMLPVLPMLSFLITCLQTRSQLRNHALLPQTWVQDTGVNITLAITKDLRGM
uniref:Uncharacterized protein n=1 Tax=Arundo donax TaxID=35708 RepID=A0A0A9DJY0_ARUDO